MKQYYIKLNELYFNSSICLGRALRDQYPTKKDFIDSFFTKDPSQAKVFSSIEDAKKYTKFGEDCKIVEIIPNSGETSKIHTEVKL